MSTESIPFLAEAIVQHRLGPDIKVRRALLYISLSGYPESPSKLEIVRALDSRYRISLINPNLS